MPARDIIVIGASAGGIEALQALVGGLPADFPGSLFVVVHSSPSGGAILPAILNRFGPLPAETAVGGAKIRPGRIYVAAPDHHLLIRPGTVCITRGPKENGFRPAVDPLFRTAAQAYRGQVVGVVLSGGLDDGTTGLADVKEAGGVAIVQDPDDATFPSMPSHAMQNVEVDHILPAPQIAAALAGLARQPLPKGVSGMATSKQIEPDIAEIGTVGLKTGTMPGAPSGFVCPGCGGALWEMKGGRIVRFRCHNGHGYTAESLVAEQTSDLETALWTALRALEENADLRRRMARRAAERNMSIMVKEYEQQAREAEERAGVLRRLLVSEPEDVSRMPKAQPTAANRDRQSDGPKRRPKRRVGSRARAAPANNGSKTHRK